MNTELMSKVGENVDKQVFKWVDIEGALHDLFDVQERAMVSFILLGDVAKALREQKQLEADRIDVVMTRNQLTPEVKSNFKTWQFKVEPWGYSWTYSPPTLWHIKVPINLYFYDHYALFENPDRVWASVENFLIPNPWESYWRGRHLIMGKLRKGAL